MAARKLKARPASSSRLFRCAFIDRAELQVATWYIRPSQEYGEGFFVNRKRRRSEFGEKLLPQAWIRNDLTQGFVSQLKEFGPCWQYSIFSASTKAIGGLGGFKKIETTCSIWPRKGLSPQGCSRPLGVRFVYVQLDGTALLRCAPRGWSVDPEVNSSDFQ